MDHIGKIDGNDFEIKTNGQTMFDSNSLSSFDTDSLGNDKRQILIRSGILMPTFLFNESKCFDGHYQGKLSYGRITDGVPRKNFNNLLEDLYELRDFFYFIPDTNMILFNQITQLLDTEISKKYNIMIPRLVIYEVERKANRKKLEVTVSEFENILNSLKKDLDVLGSQIRSKNSGSLINLQKNIGSLLSDFKDKRIGLQGLAEIYNIIKKGGILASSLDRVLDYIASDSKPIYDYLIRLEILQSTNQNKHNYIFMTNDVTNAAVASVEGLSSIYVSYNELEYSTDKLGDLIYQTAIQFNQCDFISKGQTTRFYGWWTGKVHSDWINESIGYNK
jgi:hypothetical protein